MPTPTRKQVVAASDRLSRFQPQDAVVLAILLLVTVALFWPIRQHDFINYDDPDYITANPVVQQGLTWQGVKWAFTSSHSFNWHPVTWISHMLDVQFFGMNPGAHHLSSLFLHALNALLLFWLLRKTTGTLWASAFVAAVFAWHPLHVESVAWACERKDVLSTFFWLLTTLFYVRYVNGLQVRGSMFKVEYALALGCFALGLMSKPMLVTLPFTLLLLDIWPLRRGKVLSNQFSESRRSGAKSEHWRLITDLRFWPWPRLLLEKIPFFALTLASSIVTFLAQRKDGAVVNFEHLPLADRLANAVVSYARYIGKTIWPTDMIIYYPPASWSGLQVGIALALLVVFSVGALWLFRKQPFVFVGWFWFVGTLVPVIGIVQVGAQAIADRYTYVPMIGLSIAIIWPVAEVMRRKSNLRHAYATVAGGALMALLFVSAKQVKHWRSNETIFTHALSVDSKNVVARVMLANAFLEEGRFSEAEEQFLAALAINPNFPEVHFNLGNLYIQQKRISEAMTRYETALTLNLNYPEAHANLAVALGIVNRLEEAIVHYEKSLALQPTQPETLRNLALDLMTLRRFEEADVRLRDVLKLQPSDPLALFLLGNVQLAQGRTTEAIRWYTQALEVKPDFTEARQQLLALQSNQKQ